MVTYRNRDPEPSVRFRPPHPVLKVFAVLFCCVQLLAVPAFAVEDDEWVSPEFDLQYMESGSNVFEVYGTRTHYSLDSDLNAHFEYVRNDNHSYSISYGNYPVTHLYGNVYQCELNVYNGTDAPYNHFVSDQSSYYDSYSYTQYALKGSQAFFVTDVLLQPGTYNLKANFAIEQRVMQPSGGSQYFRPPVYTIALVNDSKQDLQLHCFPDDCDVFFTIDSPSYIAFGCVPSPIVQPYNNSLSSSTWPYLQYRLIFNDLRYRTIDPMDLAALDEANTNAGNTITDYDNVEQQWTGSMSDNFAQLNVGGFSFGDGLISGFGLVSDLFMKVWVALGSYAIVYTFPLYLGIVLVLMGRVNRFIGHLDRKGDSDA